MGKELKHSELIKFASDYFYEKDLWILENFKQYEDANPGLLDQMEEVYFRINECKFFDEKVKFVYNNALQSLTSNPKKVKGSAREVCLLMNKTKKSIDKSLESYRDEIQYCMSQDLPYYFNEDLLNGVYDLIQFAAMQNVTIGFYSAARKLYKKTLDSLINDYCTCHGIESIEYVDDSNESKCVITRLKKVNNN